MKRLLRVIGAATAIVSIFGFAQGKTLTREDFVVEYRDTVSDAAAIMVAERVAAAVKIVSAYLAQAQTYQGPPYDTPLKVIIDPERFGPYQEGSEIFLPEARVLNLHNGDKDKRIDLGIVHEITHVLAASYRRENEDRFYDDGLAVYLQHRFGFEPNYPDFGEDLYVAVAKATAENGALIPLADAEATRAANSSHISRKLAYLQEGAFTQYLIERFGLNAYFRIYHGEPVEEVVGETFEELEASWSVVINATPIK